MLNKGSVKEQQSALEQQVSLHSQSEALMLELVRSQPNLEPQHLEMPQPALKTVITTIILQLLTNEFDARLKGTEKLLDHLE